MYAEKAHVLTLIAYMPSWYLVAITAIFAKEGETGEHKLKPGLFKIGKIAENLIRVLMMFYIVIDIWSKMRLPE
ncbi:hypothetical protein [Photorhabdus sp. SF281]|uniref:hypothetical protein n=1 Tax=Photorhabdus sp. SF281 TaxID=3459527 RepID=UPI004043B0A6